MTTYTIRSKHQNSQTWKRAYHRLTTAGYSNRQAEKLADALMQTKIDSMKAKLAAARPQ